MSNTALDWEQIHTLVEKVCAQIKQSDWQPTMIIGLSRGGFVPATMIAYTLGVKTVAGLAIAKDEQGVRSIHPFMKLGNLEGQKVLIVDDGIIGGHLLPQAAAYVASCHGEPKTCALISVGKAQDPDYLAQVLPEIPALPWE
jgi:hypoxanthine phosphoribosyltransferase